MSTVAEQAALVLLLRRGRRPPRHYADLVEGAGSALALLDEELGMLARTEIHEAATQIDRWLRQGWRLATILDASYPENLRTVHDRPPLVFVAGALRPADARAVAVIGARSATSDGANAAAGIARELVEDGYTVVSGLAAGIDTVAHEAVLAAGGRTIAVIGTGLARTYPPQNAALQRTIASRGAVISQFWPDAPPTRNTFRMRNVVMSGLALATVIVEASHTSGARLQARLALGHARPVLLMSTLLEQEWARQLSEKPGVHVIASPRELTETVARLTDSTLVAA